jgi:hypothetical protein
MHRGARISVSLRSVSMCVLQIEKKKNSYLLVSKEEEEAEDNIKEREIETPSASPALRSLIVIRRRGINIEFERIDRLLRAQETQQLCAFYLLFYFFFSFFTRLRLSHSCSTRLFLVVCSCRPTTAAAAAIHQSVPSFRINFFPILSPFFILLSSSLVFLFIYHCVSVGDVTERPHYTHTHTS